jgi:hypothetical protein
MLKLTPLQRVELVYQALTDDDGSSGAITRYDALDRKSKGLFVEDVVGSSW